VILVFLMHMPQLKKEMIYKQFEQVFHQFPKYHMEILLKFKLKIMKKIL
jgi:hypothetical protein